MEILILRLKFFMIKYLNMIKLKFCGGVAGSVTGACYLLETEKTKILIDCGMFQGSRFTELSNNDPFSFNPSEVDAVVITHAHIDHTGRLPKLYRDGFRGKIYGTAPTLDFTHELLRDSEHVIREEAEREGLQPFYNLDDLEKTFELTEPKTYGEEVIVSDEVKFVLRNAGHILGSSIIEVFAKESSGKVVKVVFSGDLGNYPAPLIEDTEFIEDADYIIVESAYGDRLHEAVEKRKDRLEDIIEETVNKGGVIMIPAFATERTQELLFELNELVENGRVKRVPIFVDSPLAIKITEIYRKYKNFYDEEAQRLIKKGDDIFSFPGLKFTRTVDESKAIFNIQGSKVIIAGSGMSNGGRIIHHEKHYLPDKNSTLLIIGYQIKGSLGRRLVEGEKEVSILGDRVPVRARIATIGGYSAHSDQSQLLKWLTPMRHTAKKIFVVQGDQEAADALSRIIRDQIAVKAYHPEMNEEFVL